MNYSLKKSWYQSPVRRIISFWPALVLVGLLSVLAGGYAQSTESATDTNEIEIAVDKTPAQTHSDIPSTPAYDISSDKLSHPASLVATQLADAIAVGDINSLRSVVAADVLIFESGGVESSLVEYEGHHMPADMAFMKAMQREVISQQVIDLGESATVVTRSRIHGMYKDQNIDLKSTETLVMRKVGRQWKIIHIHWSSSR